ncbi:MAG TPA: biotin/lipoyl-containing protein [Terriglobia bacterium]|nr:biotin/lipoyl-containing protein [Terriglobia bacterium]
MKFDVELSVGSGATSLEVETGPSPLSEVRAGRLDFTLGGESGSADWSEISARVYSILLGGKSYEVRAFRSDPDGRGGNAHFVIATGGLEFAVNILDRRTRRQKPTMIEGGAPQEIRAPMPGRIVKVLASEGLQVEAGDGLVVIEAMKMQNEIRAPRPGRVEKILVEEGNGVEAGASLLLLI